MPLINDIQPLLAAPHLRALSAWTTLVLFSLSLPSSSSYGILSFIIMGLAFPLLILDVGLAISRRRHRTRKTSHTITQQPHVFRPKIWVIILDFLFGAAYLVLWVLCLLVGMGTSSGYYYSGGYYGGYGVFSSFVFVGCLVVAHWHIFFASCETHILRKMNKGATAAAEATMQMQTQMRDGEVVIVKDGAAIEMPPAYT